MVLFASYVLRNWKTFADIFYYRKIFQSSCLACTTCNLSKMERISLISLIQTKLKIVWGFDFCSKSGDDSNESWLFSMLFFDLFWIWVKIFMHFFVFFFAFFMHFLCISYALFMHFLCIFCALFMHFLCAFKKCIKSAYTFLKSVYTFCALFEGA